MVSTWSPKVASSAPRLLGMLCMAEVTVSLLAEVQRRVNCSTTCVSTGAAAAGLVPGLGRDLVCCRRRRVPACQQRAAPHRVVAGLMCARC